MKSYNIGEIKNKFGRLLSYAGLQCGLSVDIINSKLKESSYFDFMEKDEVDVFLKTEISDICFNVFGVKEKVATDKYRNDLMYAGESYISTSISLSIPLRKLFILLPLEEMLSLFDIYHEMNPFRIIEEIKNRIKNRSIYQFYINRHDYNVNQLSIITGIDRRVLKELKDNSDIEKKIPYEKLFVLAQVLGIDEYLLSSSRFVPYYFAIWKNDVFVSCMKKYISLISGTSIPVFLNNELLPNRGGYILLSYQDAKIYRSDRLIEKIPNYKYDLALTFSIKDYRYYCLDNDIAFC